MERHLAPVALYWINVRKFIMIMTRLLVGTWALSAIAAHARSPKPSVPGDTATTLKYESDFVGYRLCTEIALISWRKANQDAAAVGGHMASGMRMDAPAKETSVQPDPASSTGSAPVAADAAAHPR